MKKLHLGLLSAIFSLLVFVASTSTQPLCYGLLYQPEVPSSLKLN